MATIPPRPKILLIDDSALVRAVVAHALRNDADVVSIDDPRKLAEVMATEAPSLLLVDATFPGLNDDALVDLVRPQKREGCCIVVFSDRPAKDLASLAEKLGAAAVVPKEAAGGELWPRLSPLL